MTTSSVNFLVYQPEGAMEAAAAGHILLSIVAVSLMVPRHPRVIDHLSDYLDLLFWFHTRCLPPSLHRSIRPQQGRW